MSGARAHVGRAKTTVPVHNSSTLPRARLDACLDLLLDRGPPVPLMLVTAPAGFGKTTLLGDWARAVAGTARPVAWCSLDENDASCFRLWSALLTAIERAVPPEVAARVAGLSAPRSPGDGELLADLSEALAGCGLVLVVENVHAITDDDTLRDLNFLLGHPPGDALLVASSRYEPPLMAVQAAKLEARLEELRTQDLAFTAAEVAELCPGLPDEGVDAVWEWTEGWPALVRLMEFALRTMPREEVVRTTHDGDLAGYLFHETFSRQSDRVRNVLMLTSVPDTVTDDLAARLSGDPRAGTVLEDVARQSGLITRTRQLDDDASYRLHPLLRSYLRQELHRTAPDLEQEAHRVSARWLLSHGHHLTAVRHAAAVDDVDFRDDIVRAAGPGLINAGEGGLLIDVLAAPSDPQRATRAWTRLVRSAALLDAGRLAEAAAEFYRVAPESLAGDDDRTDTPELVTTWQAIDVHLRRRQGRPSDPRRLLEPADVRDPDLRVLLAVHRGATLLRQGAFAAAETELDLGLELATGLGRTAAVVDCLTFRAAVHAARSELRPLVLDADEALRLGELNGWAHTPRMAHVHLLRGWAYYQSLQDDLADWHVERSFDLLSPGSEPSVRVAVHAFHAALAAREGFTRDASQPSLHEVVMGSTSGEIGPMTVVFAACIDVHESLRTGRVEHIPEVIEVVRERVGECGELDLMAALVAESQGRRSAARHTLTRVLVGAAPEVASRLSRLEVLTCAARLAHLDGDTGAAHDLAWDALALAERLGCFRPLVTGGAAMADLLRTGRGGWGWLEPTAELVIDYDATPSRSMTDLTARELEILRELPSLRTVEDIGASLFVSVNTVKTHVRRIYRKLGVGTRREAVAEAARRGLV